MMTTEDVGRAVRKHCEDGTWLEAVDQLYADDVVSVEPVAHPGMPAVMEGKDVVRKKSEGFMAMSEVHSNTVTGPFVDGDRFALRLEIDYTHKESGQRITMKEMALYQVRDGKVVHEEFFYNAES